MSAAHMKRAGFTVLELLVVLGIIAILAAVAVFAYGRYVKQANTSEVYAMISSIRQAEETYRAENGAYLSTGVNEDDFYPVLGSQGQEPVKKLFKPSTKPLWQPLGVKAPGKYLYCGYVVIAGPPGDLSAAGPRGRTLFGNQPPGVIWYYVRATCDQDGDAAKNSYFETTFARQTVYVDNEGH